VFGFHALAMRIALITSLLLAAACGDDDAPEDAGMPDAGSADAGVMDAGIPDAGPPPEDAGPDGGDPSCTEAPDAAMPSIDAGAPMLPEALDCGEPTIVDGALRRWPYLQSATPGSVRVLWTTTTGGEAVLRYAADPEGEWTEVDANAETFETERTNDAEEYVQYEVRVDGLEEGTRYCYELVEGGEVVASGLRFETAWRGEGARPVRFLAIGDSGQASDGQRAVRDEFMAYEHDLFLHLGDIAYGDGTFQEFEENHFAIYRDILHSLPFWPTIGNHDDKTDRAQPYLDVFSLPEQALAEAEHERYYSFDYGNVHFVSIDSNDGTLIPIALDLRGTREDDMLDWLAMDLAESDAEWKIAFFHHPPYTSSSRSPNGVVRNNLLPMLEAGGVDLVLSGHDHHYERTLPILDGCVAMDDDAITYVVAGAGGASLRGDVTPQWWHAASLDSKHSFVRFTIQGCVAYGEAIDADGELVDEFTIDGCD